MLPRQTAQDTSPTPSVPPFARDISGSLAHEGQSQKYTSYAGHLPRPGWRHGQPIPAAPGLSRSRQRGAQSPAWGPFPATSGTLLTRRPPWVRPPPEQDTGTHAARVGELGRGQLRQRRGAGAREEQKELKQHGPKDKNSNRVSVKERSHSHFPGIGRKGFGRLQTRERVMIAFEMVLQEEDRSAPSFKGSITRNRALDYVTSSPK